MTTINLTMFCAMLFSVGFFVELTRIRRAAKKSTPAAYLLSALLLLATSQLPLLYSGYSVMKFAVAEYFIILSIHRLFATERTRLLLNAVYLVFGAVMYSIVTIVLIPQRTLNLLLLAATGAYTLIAYRDWRKGESKEALETSVIALVAAVLMVSSSSLLSLFSGALVFTLYQCWDLYMIARRESRAQSALETRLDDLENRFTRQVENEARRRTTRMSDQVEEIRETAQKDPLTKALNRAGINSEINALINDPYVKIFSVALIDLDHFKEINDSLGHMAGDETLKFLSGYIMKKNRRTDIWGRFGGDEFVLIMPNINAPAAIKIMNRIRGEIELNSNPKFTISVGIASYPYDGKTIAALLSVADRALYHSKEAGKNRVTYSGNVPVFPEE